MDVCFTAEAAAGIANELLHVECLVDRQGLPLLTAAASIHLSQVPTAHLGPSCYTRGLVY